MHGYVDKISATIVAGWAYERGATEPARVRVMLDGKILAEGLTHLARRHLDDPHAPPVLRGFNFQIPAIEAHRAKDVIVEARGSDGWHTLPRSKTLSTRLQGKRPHKKAYQDFDGTGSSKSFEKLQRLRLDLINSGNLSGMSVLDIGCNEGFFCRAALQAGASRVVGIDSNKVRINSAKKRVPGVEFHNKRWSQLPDETFDIIFFLSAIHYERNQKELLRNILTRLKPGGTLILECGIAEVKEEKWFKSFGRHGWHTAMRHDGLKRYPTYDMLVRELLADYSVRTIGKSIDQAGDPIPRWVLHCTPKQTTAILIAADSRAGKTTLSLEFDKLGIPAFRLDPLLSDLLRDERYAWTEIARKIGKSIDKNKHLNLREVVDAIIKEGLEEELTNLIWNEIPREVSAFVVEGEALTRPTIYKMLATQLRNGGIRPWIMQPVPDE